MSTAPIFVATHPRACSTAFERVFMKRPDLQCIHEPFGDAFYYGPERLSSRFGKNEKTRIERGFSHSTYQTINDRIHQEAAEGKRLFVKDMAYYLFAPEHQQTYIAPSLARKERGIGTTVPSATGGAPETDGIPNGAMITEPDNPTVLPRRILEQFHFTFLIRHPSSSVPSFFRCTVPPLDEMTGFYEFMPSEAGYSELRRLFDYVREYHIGPGFEPTSRGSPIGAGNETQDISKSPNTEVDVANICVVDADDLLDDPAGTIQAYCNSVGLSFDPGMLTWDTEEDRKHVDDAFAKWKGFHEDAIESKCLSPRTHEKKRKTVEQEDAEWTEKFGQKGAKVIRDTVHACMEDYEYLKQFTLKALRN